MRIDLLGLHLELEMIIYLFPGVDLTFLANHNKKIPNK